MHLGKSRAGLTGFETVFAILLVVLLVGLGLWTHFLNQKVNALEARGRALTAWLGNTDDIDTPNQPSGGLTTWLIHLKNHVTEHIGQKVTPAGPAHTGAGDNHLDPPPPPPWGGG